MEESGIKKLIQRARDEAHLVEREPFRGEIDEEEAKRVREQMELLEELQGYSRAQDIYRDFSAQAAKQLVFESRFGKSSSDRTRASTEILDRAHGKPVNRQLNMNLSANEMSMEHLRSQTERLLVDLGYREGVNANRLIIGESEAGEALPDFDRREGDSGREPPQES